MGVSRLMAALGAATRMPCWHTACLVRLLNLQPLHVTFRISNPCLIAPMKVSCSCVLFQLIANGSRCAKSLRWCMCSLKKSEVEWHFFCDGQSLLCNTGQVLCSGWCAQTRSKNALHDWHWWMMRHLFAWSCSGEHILECRMHQG